MSNCSARACSLTCLLNKNNKDYIAPPGFDFRYPSRFKSGSIYGSVSYLDMIAPKFTDEMVKNIVP